MNTKNLTNTQLRLSEDMKKYVENKAKNIGVSQNAMILMLMELGRKILDSEKITVCQK